ncbi:hypothetical protein MJG53_006045 [Ovis ammon polii x Ovis aries]|uniref:Uncharacterized protein n=1 Tax=Ovis ammon polii x Ovis aries TaxID=2918886 RepID=A0ACB9V7A4_9CETA|nr:hypothetical protein MJT46_005615 [Ovis ammon polii x Ovis aries]KAI4585811.1 hypothetical protein MJG53_006045 [Ovis ammon polii x Ovis aries]
MGASAVVSSDWGLRDQVPHADHANRLTCLHRPDSPSGSYTMEYNLHEVMTQSNRFRALHETKRGHKSVFPASKTTILDLTTTAAINVATTTAKLWGPEEVRSSEAWLLSSEAVIRLTLSGAVLKILIVVLIAYLLWKRIKAGESLGTPFHVQEGYR